jgi:16S rRNA C967 or C1407 C5-methylase (RsmB/RsmF family)/NOL1/NOP2/fmu family ribosome biogenesis protein
MKAHDTRRVSRNQPDIPAAFLERMAPLLGAEYAAFLASYDATPSVGLRVNILKIAPEAFRQIAPFALAPVPWCSAGFTIIGDDVEPGKHPFHTAGLYYLQDPSAMAVAELLDPQPGERVLDLASAPGGKATHIAAKMQGQGLLVANEIHPKRAWELAGNLERWGAINTAVTNETPERLAERFAGFFDRVLVDAPCSGEGMMRKGEAARVEWAPELVRGCALRQTTILEQAARLVRPGGRLAYSTCTFNPEENEGTVARFLADHPAFELIEPARQPGFASGRADCLGAEAVGPAVAPAPDARHPRDDAPAGSHADLTRAVRLWPHLAPGEGHFIAVLRRQDAEPVAATSRPWRPIRLPRPVEAAYRAFCAEHLAAEPAGERLALVGSYLYALADGLPNPSSTSGRGLTGLRFLHPGWWLGTLMKDRFEPSHALALALRPEFARRSVSLASHDPALAAYLRGESFRCAGESGWVLVCVDGHPLGWGKRVGETVKSHYPRGLRRT